MYRVLMDESLLDPVVVLSSGHAPKTIFEKLRNLLKNRSSRFQTGDMLRKLFRGSTEFFPGFTGRARGEEGLFGAGWERLNA
jgi:hypothetical protein